ncbi:hypothetical protein LR48_Vigan02g226600 [Vigna angularis]|uniref:Uncharacterized protein n=2 Tax=Phaseolus angularis TaxID=3914 RepID=A0A0L9U036_PHAAN|nr:hypothetical protein LR48_Vigan02g226600 [Vigna angularis]BAT94058.1 hypothetical protein VIGAN_08062600 [Vigna angularis var. angularis]
MNFNKMSFEPAGLNYGHRPHQNGVACKLCNHVSPDFQAFIAHTESHFSQQNSTLRSLYSPNHVNSQREIIPNPLRPNFPRPTMMQEKRNFNNTVFQTSPLQPVFMPRPRTNLFSHASQPVIATSQPFHGPPSAMSFHRNSVNKMTLFPSPLIHQRDMKTSSIDGTKPYINLLDKPINNNGFFKCDIISGNSLDLSLRL